MAKTKETPKMQILKAEDVPSVSSLSNDERLELIEALQEEIDSRTTAINSKFYIVEGGVATGTAFLKFLNEDAEWKFTEAYGVIECVKEVEAAMKKAQTGAGEIFLQVLPLEAMWFFINKTEGKGLQAARYYHDNLLKPIGGALSRVKADRDEVNELMLRQGGLEAGADFEAPIDPVKAVKENATA